MTGERNKVVRKIRDIAEKYHFAANDGELSGKNFPNNLVLTSLSYILDKNHLLIGDPGWGKTTTAQLVSSVYSGIPFDLYESTTVEGHPGLFTEKWKARPDYGELTGRKEVVIWQGGFGLNAFIVDEINRVSPDVQDEMLEGIRTGRWKYLNDVLYEGKKPTFMTMNYRDNGNGEIIPPLEDRIDIVTEESAGSPLDDYESAQERIRADLGNPEITTAALDALKEKNFSKFKDAITRSRKGNYLTPEEKKSIQEQIKAMPWTNDAYYFLWTFASEMNFNQKYGKKRARDPISDDEHDKNYAGINVKNSFSPRPLMAARAYASGLAWLLGDKKVELDHVRYALPFTSAHRMKFTDDLRNAHGNDHRVDYEDLHLAKALVGKVEQSYDKSIRPMRNLVAQIQQGKIKVKKTDNGNKIIVDGKEMVLDDFDHPLLRHIMEKKVLAKPFTL